MITQPSTTAGTGTIAGSQSSNPAGTWPTGATDRSATTAGASLGRTDRPDRFAQGHQSEVSMRARDGMHRFVEKAHRAIDKLEQTLGPRGAAAGSQKGEYGQRARQYGERVRQYGEQARHYGEQALQYGQQTREHVHQHPLQSAGIAFAAGLMYSKLFMHRTKVRIVKVPVPIVPPEFGKAFQSYGKHARRTMHSAGGRLHELGESGQHAMGKLADASMMGIAGAKSLSSRVWHKAREAVPHSMGAVKARSQVYGSMTREQMRGQMRQHPMAGLGLAIGLGALASTLLLGRNSDARPIGAGSSRTMVVDKDGRALGGEGVAVEGYRRAGGMRSRPVMSAALVLTAGVLLGALLRR